MSAQQAKEALDGWDLYEGFNTLKIEYANVSFEHDFIGIRESFYVDVKRCK